MDTLEGRALMLETRVVILDREPQPAIGVIDLPYPAVVGVEFEHDGRRWRVVGRRLRTRVLLASECPPGACRELQA
jgi:hypothetical protein